MALRNLTTLSTLRPLVPASALAAALGLGVVLGTGCQHAASAASGQDGVAQTPAPFATPPVLPGTPDVATLVARVKPAVVNITTIHEVKVGHSGMQFPGFGDLFRMMPHGQNGGSPFEQGPDDQGSGGGDEVMKQQALGSGFLVDAQGHVVTNAHVIDGADMVKVKLADDREFRAKVVGKDTRLDVAVLQLLDAPKDLPAAALGQSEPTRVGEYVVAIGNPFGLGHTVTMGIVSAKGRTIGAGPEDDFIQTDASINPGNSGGPLFNLRGQVVGINTAINPNGKGIGFAIPIDAVKQILPQLIATGHVQRGRLGVVVQPMDGDLAQAVGLDRAKGALVEDVESGSPAEQAGIKPGDVIVSIDGQDVPHSGDLPRMVAPHPPGTQVRVGVWHDRKLSDKSLTLAALKDEGARSEVTPQGPAEQTPTSSSLGIAVADEEGKVVVARVTPDGPADGKLQRGDVIEEIDHAPVTGGSDLVAKLKAAPLDRPVLLRVRHGDQARYVAIERGASK
jgi:serine protease Do